MKNDKVLVVKVNEIHFDADGKVDEGRLSFEQAERSFDDLTDFQKRALDRAALLEKHPSPGRSTTSTRKTGDDRSRTAGSGSTIWTTIMGRVRAFFAPLRSQRNQPKI